MECNVNCSRDALHNNQPDGRSNLTAEGHGNSELVDKIESYIYST
jgi:hypothetical protein